MTPMAIADELGKSGFCICPRFLTGALLQNVREDLLGIQAAGGFHEAGTGSGNRPIKGGLVRKDEIHWLDRELENPVQKLLWDKLDLLMSAFNQKLFLGITKFEGHYASYPEDGYYKRHRDCFRDDSDRMVSLVLYLNKDWKSADGGRLRIYNGDAHTDVNPEEGTLVCFMSRDFEHEVMLNHRERLSFTGWFKVRAIGRTVFE